jgi:hypothetical protein
MAAILADDSTVLTPSLDWLNTAIPLPLLGVSGITAEERLAAREARLNRWAGQYHHPLGRGLDSAFEAEPSVASWGTTVPDEVGEAADTAILCLPASDVSPSEWTETLRGLPAAIAGLLEPWAEPAVRARVREYLGHQRLAAVADHFWQREERIAEAYRAAGRQPIPIETPWDRWDVRRSIFDHVGVLQVCESRYLYGRVERGEAIGLMRRTRNLFPEAHLPDFQAALFQAARFAVGNFSLLHEGVFELPGVGFEVAIGLDGTIVAASPGRVQVRPVKSGCAIELSFPDWEAKFAELPNRAWITERTLFDRLTWAGAPVSQKLVAECLRAGLMDRIRTAAAGGGCHGY